MAEAWHDITDRLGFAEVFDRLRAGSARRDRERALPRTEVAEVNSHGFGRLRLDKNDGGRGISVTELFALVEDLSYADPNIAHIFRNHLNFVEQVLLNFEPESRSRFIAKIGEGTIFAASLENYSGASGANEHPETPVEDAQGYRFSVKQYYSTGNLYADVLSVPLEIDGATLTAFVPTAAEGVSLPDDWTGFGQRLTGSGATIFTDVVVDPDQLVDYSAVLRADRPAYTATFPQLYLLHIISGIVRAILDDAVAVNRGRVRNYYHGLAERPSDDPNVQTTIGQISAIALTIRYLLRGVAVDFERAVTRDENTQAIDAEAVRLAAVNTAKAKSTVQDLALRAATLLFDATSGSSLSDELNLDRHWRNIRTIANHNPRTYKERLIGRLELTGEALPSGKAFF